MTKPNYKAWNVNESDFPKNGSDLEKLTFFARYAVLAPSGHNSQPWKLTAKENSIIVDINPDHHLKADGSGLLSVEPYVSIGTFLEVFFLGGRGFGYNLAINLFPTKNHIAEISITSKTTPVPKLLRAIATRKSNRHNFEKTAVSPTVIKQITDSKLVGLSMYETSNRDELEFIAEKTEEAIASIMGNSRYRLELSEWVRTNHTRKYDGMPGFTHGFGNLKSLLSKTAVRHAPNQGPQVKKSGNLIRNTGNLIIVCCKKDDKEFFINAGRIYSQICVLANQLGFDTSALGASVIDPKTRAEVKKRFGITDRPIYILRLGKSLTKSRHSPRWPLEKVLSFSKD